MNIRTDSFSYSQYLSSFFLGVFAPFILVLCYLSSSVSLSDKYFFLQDLKDLTKSLEERPSVRTIIQRNDVVATEDLVEKTSGLAVENPVVDLLGEMQRFQKKHHFGDLSQDFQKITHNYEKQINAERNFIGQIHEHSEKQQEEIQSEYQEESLASLYSIEGEDEDPMPMVRGMDKERDDDFDLVAQYEAMKNQNEQLAMAQHGQDVQNNPSNSDQNNSDQNNDQNPQEGDIAPRMALVPQYSEFQEEDIDPKNFHQEEAVLQDEVSQIQSASVNEEPVVSTLANQNTDQNTEESTETTSPLSPAVLAEVARVAQSSSSGSTTSGSATPISTMAGITGPSSVLSRSNDVKKEELVLLSSEAQAMTETAQDAKQAKLYLYADKIQLNTGTIQDVGYFDFRPFFDSQRDYRDLGNGVISLESRQSHDHHFLSGEMVHQDCLVTQVELDLEEGVYQYRIPLLDGDSLNQFLSSKGMEGQFSYLLVDLHDKVEEVTLLNDLSQSPSSKEGENVFYFSEEFKELPSAEGKKIGKYALFVTMSQSNQVLEYELLGGKKWRKIIHLFPGQVSFELSHFEEGLLSHHFELYEERPLAKTGERLEITKGSLYSFTTQDAVESSTGQDPFWDLLHEMRIHAPGARHYYQWTPNLQHPDQTVFFGQRVSKKAEGSSSTVLLPSVEYQDLVFQQLGLESLDGQCLVMINLPKERTLEDFAFEGVASQGLPIHAKYLNREGQWLDDLSRPLGLTKIFLYGPKEGLISTKITYRGGVEEYLQTYCSANTLLVEQL